MSYFRQRPTRRINLRGRTGLRGTTDLAKPVIISAGSGADYTRPKTTTNLEVFTPTSAPRVATFDRVRMPSPTKILSDLSPSAPAASGPSTGRTGVYAVPQDSIIPIIEQQATKARLAPISDQATTTYRPGGPDRTRAYTSAGPSSPAPLPAPSVLIPSTKPDPVYPLPLPWNPPYPADAATEAWRDRGGGGGGGGPDEEDEPEKASDRGLPDVAVKPWWWILAAVIAWKVLK